MTNTENTTSTAPTPGPQDSTAAGRNPQDRPALSDKISTAHTVFAVGAVVAPYALYYGTKYAPAARTHARTAALKVRARAQKFTPTRSTVVRPGSRRDRRATAANDAAVTPGTEVAHTSKTVVH